MTLTGISAGLGIALLTALLLAWKWQLGVARTVVAILVLGAAVAGLEASISSGVRWSLAGQVCVAWAGTMAAGFACLAFMFYRDPPRVPPPLPGAVLSPADGRIVYVRDVRGGELPAATKRGRRYALTELTRHPVTDGEAVVVGISMSLLDVHVNRVPVSGRVSFSSRIPGGFGSLRRVEMLFENERATTLIESRGMPVAVVQIASRLVRRIALFVRPGQEVRAGEKLGAIRLGSQVDLVLPRTPGLTVAVREGERVRAGETVIAFAGTEPARATPGAVVVGGDYRGLCITRSLGRNGVPVWVLALPGELLASSSRYVRRVIRVPSVDDEDLVPRLLALAERWDLERWALFPTTDEAAMRIAHGATRLAARYALTSPGWDALRWAYDKRLTIALARYARVPYPRTFTPGDSEELERRSVSFPVVLKPAIKVRSNAFTHARAWMADNVDSLARLYRRACLMVPPEVVLVQEHIPGGGECQASFAAVCRDGVPVAWLTARRLRQYPSRFGRSSTLVETAEIPEVEEAARKLLAAVNYSGLVEVEFKRDRETEAWKVLDINPRAWTWIMLGAAAGTDFPWLQWKLIRDGALEPCRALEGVRWLRLGTDALAFAGQALRGELSVSAWVRSIRRPVQISHFAGDDPLPALMAMPSHVAVRVARILGKLRRRSAEQPPRPGPSRPWPAPASVPRHG